MDRQAVIIIHGIGEQKPTDTLRGFVKSIIGHETNDTSKGIYSKPDDYSDLYELRRMTISHPKTDFLEYYWAHEMSGSKISDVFNWFRVLILRSPSSKSFPKRLLWLYLLIWATLAISLYIAIKFGLWKLLIGESIGTDTNFTKIIGIVSPILLIIFSSILVNYVGDAARYMTPAPHNIPQRQNIRKNGLKLLEKLHEQKEPDGSYRYNRIVVVGHSLGSVIAYDLISNLWNKYNKTHNKPATINQKELEEMSKLVDKLKNKSLNEITDDELKQYQEKQLELWKEQKELGNFWRITDFITLGSPLAHARLLLSKNLDDLNEKINDREFPICPPKIEPDINGISYSLSPPYTVEIHGQIERRTIKVLHHAAPFAVTKWVNIYYKNDFVGGKIEDFGSCIENVGIESNYLFRRIVPFISHTHYWNPKEKKAIDTLRKKLKLRF